MMLVLKLLEKERDEPVCLELSDLWEYVLKLAYMYYLQKTSNQILLKVSLVSFLRTIQ